MSKTEHDPQSASPADGSGQAERRSNPGILVFTTCLQLLYVNEEARALFGQMNKGRSGKVMNGVVPLDVLEICQSISKGLSSGSGAKDLEHFQQKRIVNGHERSVLIRGLALPDKDGPAKSRILILMEAVAGRKDIFTQRVHERFRLTAREQTVVSYLMKGLTNKEIAGLMLISEQTVKEHVKHIMGKTKTTTRTGVLSTILRSEPIQELAKASITTPPS